MMSDLEISDLLIMYIIILNPKFHIRHPKYVFSYLFPPTPFPVSPKGERLRPLLPPGGRLGRGLRDKGKVGKGVEG
jgi:hypothetical protein